MRVYHNHLVIGLGSSCNIPIRNVRVTLNIDTRSGGNEVNVLHNLLPPRNNSNIGTRRKRFFQLPIVKTNRLKNSFIMNNSYNYY